MALHPFILLATLILSLGLGCRAADGSPEAVADSFVEAYFRRADQEKAKQFTAFSATKMLEEELAEVRKLRDSGYTPGDASLTVSVERKERTSRGHRVRFHYLIKYPGSSSHDVKHADVELSQVEGSWKVVRVGLSDKPAPGSE